MIKIWDEATKNQTFEFSSELDKPLLLAAQSSVPLFAVGYESGFVRVFDALSNKQVMENLIYESPIRAIKFSPDERFLAVMCENSRIVVFAVQNEFAVVKTIDYDFPNNNYYSIDFSRDGSYLANISTNANTITVWETDNFTLKYKLDLTGEIIRKLSFAPNSKDLLLLTATSKLKYFRVGRGEITEFKEVPNLHDFECLDFEISPNNKFIITLGKEGLVKVFDYFMRGTSISPSA